MDTPFRARQIGTATRNKGASNQDVWFTSEWKEDRCPVRTPSGSGGTTPAAGIGGEVGMWTTHLSTGSDFLHRINGGFILVTISTGV